MHRASPGRRPGPARRAHSRAASGPRFEPRRLAGGIGGLVGPELDVQPLRRGSGFVQRCSGEHLDPPHVDTHARVELEGTTTRGGFRRVVHHHAIDEVVVIAFHLDVESMGVLAIRRLCLDRGDRERHQRPGGLGELRSHRKPTAEARQKLVLHRRMHIGSDQRLELGSARSVECDSSLLSCSDNPECPLDAPRISEVIHDSLACAR